MDALHNFLKFVITLKGLLSNFLESLEIDSNLTNSYIVY